MKKLALLLCLSALTLAGYAQELGLPDNSAAKPARAAKINTSYAAIVCYPSHSEDLYFDLGQMTDYITVSSKGERRIAKLDSLVAYTLNDNKKTYEVISMQGIGTKAKTTKKIDVKLEEVVYDGRWCIVESYKQVENEISLEGDEVSNAVGTTEFVVYTDMETGIVLREEQNGGTMMELSHISLGPQPSRRFSIPKDYTKAGGKDIGKMVSDMKKAQDSADPAAAMKELLKNMNQYKTK